IFALIMAPREPSLITKIPPAIKDLANIQIVPEVNAQTGFGFTALNPILALWKGSRDITYGLMVIAIITLAFMVMFKVKLNPQTSITIQSAIPKVVIALILITFSYAISGLLVDLMYVVYGILSIAARPLALNLNPTFVYGLLTGSTLPGGFLSIVMFVFTLMAIVVSVLSIILGVLFSGVSAGLSAIIGIAIALIVFLIIFLQCVKIIWALLKAYALALIMTIIAPFYILLGVVIPTLGFGSWLRMFISNLAVFVVTSLLCLLSLFFLFSGVSSLGIKVSTPIGLAIIAVQSAENRSWPPLLGGGGEAMAAIIMAGVGLVIFVIIPKSTELIQALIKGQQFNYGAAFNEAIVVPAQGVSSYMATKHEKAIDAPSALANFLRGVGFLKGK
ncbi:MAG: hypothetical protein AAB656_04640, partial [Patescibacteria group bacterium]